MCGSWLHVVLTKPSPPNQAKEGKVSAPATSGEAIFCSFKWLRVVLFRVYSFQPQKETLSSTFPRTSPHCHLLQAARRGALDRPGWADRQEGLKKGQISKEFGAASRRCPWDWSQALDLSLIYPPTSPAWRGATLHCSRAHWFEIPWARLLAVWPWPYSLTFLFLHFLICKMGE